MRNKQAMRINSKTKRKSPVRSDARAATKFDLSWIQCALPPDVHAHVLYLERFSQEPEPILALYIIIDKSFDKSRLHPRATLKSPNISTRIISQHIPLWTQLQTNQDEKTKVHAPVNLRD
jgi:hypothetical protein